jgi:hypothetical protein
MADTEGNRSNDASEALGTGPTRWLTERAEVRDRCNSAKTVADISRMSGVPDWLIFKVVSLELEQRVYEVMNPADGSEKEMLAAIITESISYARELTREDTWRAVWPRRRMASLKAYLKDWTEAKRGRS